MTLTKRQFLATTAATMAATALPARVWSQTSLTMGGMEITTLSDGNLTLPADFIFGPMDQDALAPLLSEFGIDRTAPLTPPCNITLLRHEDRLVLFDTGSGFSFQNTAGQLIDTLDAAGIAADDITHVVFTHGHPDHLWGVLDDFDEATFFNAEHMMGETEFAYWTDPATPSAIGEARASFAVGAERRLSMLGDQITRIQSGTEILPGVTSMLTPGHTPGHMSFLLSDGTETAFILGDVATNDHISFARPAWASGSDQDSELGAQTRAAVLDQVASDEMKLIGFHLPEGGIGHVTREAEGYSFTPITG